MDEKQMKKMEIRAAMLKKRQALSREEILQAEKESLPAVLSFLRKIHEESAERLLPDVGSRRPLTVMSYMSFQKEFPTHTLNETILREGFRLVLPYTDPDFQILPCAVSDLDSLPVSRLGIPEPDPAVHRQVRPEEIHVVLMPGIAFDPAGNRIGFGKGCYDRFLSQPSFLPVTAALAYDFQLTPEIPAQPSDIPCGFLLHGGRMLPALRR